MPFFELKPKKGAIKKRKIKGRGNASGLGGECGRGHKGQKSRTGYRSKPGFEGGQTPLYRRLPKKRGMSPLFKQVYNIVNIRDINKHFSEGEVVDIEGLVNKRLANPNFPVKVLSVGDLNKKLTIKAQKISKAALEKIEQSGSAYEFVA